MKIKDSKGSKRSHLAGAHVYRKAWSPVSGKNFRKASTRVVHNGRSRLAYPTKDRQPLRGHSLERSSCLHITSSQFHTPCNTLFRDLQILPLELVAVFTGQG